MIGIKELIEYQTLYMEYVINNIDWSELRDEGLTDEDECMEHFLFEATRQGFDFVDFIEDSYKINDIEDVITGKTVCDMIQFSPSYYMNKYWENRIDFDNLTVKDVLRYWVYVHTHLKRDEIIRERIKENVMLLVIEKQLEQFWGDSYEIGYTSNVNKVGTCI